MHLPQEACPRTSTHSQSTAHFLWQQEAQVTVQNTRLTQECASSPRIACFPHLGTRFGHYAADCRWARGPSSHSEVTPTHWPTRTIFDSLCLSPCRVRPLSVRFFLPKRNPLHSVCSLACFLELGRSPCLSFQSSRFLFLNCVECFLVNSRLS